MPASIPDPACRMGCRYAAAWKSAHARPRSNSRRSPEYNTLVNQATGTATLSVQHDANNSVTFTFPQMAFQVAENAEADGIVAVTVTGAPQYSNSQNTVMSVTTLCGVAGIAQ